MAITKMRWYPYSVPFRHPFTTAHGTLTMREGAIVEVFVEGNGSGIGEIAPMPEFGGETLDAALTILPSIAAHLSGRTLIEALNYVSIQQEAGELPAGVACGLEIALLDALGKQEGCSISTLLATNAAKTVVAANAVIGAQPVEAAARQAREAVAAGFRCLKLKIGHGLYEEIERVAAVRKAVGPEIHLRLDGNEGWSFEQARTILAACEPFAIQYVEQPLRVYDLSGMYRLRQEVSIPIAADEAVYNLESARRVLDWQAADVLIVKPQLVGGLRVGQRIVYEAAKYDVPCVVTSMIETGVGLLGALHLAAALPYITLECGFATLPLLADNLICEPCSLQHGILVVPQQPGLGVTLDRTALAKYRRTIQ
ncbi:dipeptide epimerase [Reticulibacter mediterranei]|uniref:o-succinylbenzoate synthase n=1 Tax=Reticulibacter mediterranei TaxID=2778369 RepID=A0A8J3III6_9CHLR|nr:o-succinylbenzoate synthase [Reticulibacter mediterranei]GHO95186.1 dipeptide epimerase [Reticulibacter mediterranei]